MNWHENTASEPILAHDRAGPWHVVLPICAMILASRTSPHPRRAALLVDLAQPDWAEASLVRLDLSITITVGARVRDQV